MITVQAVKPSPNGFGQYDLSEPMSIDGFDSLDDYITEALGVDYTIDDDCEKAAAAADGNTHNQGNGRIVGFKDDDGFVTLWLIREV